MGKPIKIVDRVMGSGKSLGMIESINNRTPKDRYESPMLVIVPLDTEVKRYIEKCPQEQFVEPEKYWSTHDSKIMNKTESILRLLSMGKSIVTTHALFALFTPEIEREITFQKYNIVIDEESPAFHTHTVTKYAWKEINELKYIDMHPITKRLTWTGPIDSEYDGFALSIRDKILTGDVYYLENFTLLIIQTPISFFSLVDNYTILTYMFSCSNLASYFKINKIDYVIDTQDVDECIAIKRQFKDLIEILPSPRSIQQIADNRKTHFSYTYWAKRKPDELKKIRETLGTHLTRLGIKTEEMVYACPKGISSKEEDITKKGKHVQIKGFKGHTVKIEKDNGEVDETYHSNWIPYNSRATNEYSYKTVIVYMSNVYENTPISTFIDSTEYKKTQEEHNDYSLSIMLQCIWRTAIRNNKNIKVMILSNRMREMFINWLG